MSAVRHKDRNHHFVPLEDLSATSRISLLVPHSRGGACARVTAWIEEYVCMLGGEVAGFPRRMGGAACWKKAQRR